MADGTGSVVTERSCRTRSGRIVKSTSVASLDEPSIHDYDQSSHQSSKDEDRKTRKKNEKGAASAVSLHIQSEFGNHDNTTSTSFISTNPKSKRKDKTGKDKSALDSDQPCAKCDGVIHDNVKALQCEFCAAWVCLVCTGMPEPVYDAIMDNDVPNFIWTCDSCMNAVPTIRNLSKMLQSVKEEQHVSREQVEKLNIRVERLEESIDDKVQSAIDEYRAREARKTNVIIHNIPESECEEAADRKKEDSEAIEDLIKNGLDLGHVKMEAVVRLGKKVEGKARLTKVQLDTVKSKREMLNNAKKLRNTASWSRIYITPDLSPKEREENRKLREELKKRTADGEEGLVIRRGKIIMQTPSSTNKGDSGSVHEEAAASSTFRT